jgi:YD repeat-containing protein
VGAPPPKPTRHAISLTFLVLFACSGSSSGPGGLPAGSPAGDGAVDTGSTTDSGDGGAGTSDGGTGDGGTGDGGADDSGGTTDSGDGGTDSGDGGGDTGVSPEEAAAEALRDEMAALLAAESACQAAGEKVPEHDPSWARGLFYSPEGGSEYDPRLAGCTWRARDLSGAKTDHEAIYDDLGRKTDLDRSNLGVGDPHTYEWSDDGCLLFDTSFTGTGRAYVVASVCDDHGYLLCEVNSNTRSIDVWTNTYTDDLLIKAEEASEIDYFAWEDERVVSAVYWGSSYIVWEYTWEVDRIVERVLTSDHGMDATATTWTYDDAGRVVGTSSTEGGVTSGEAAWDYDGEAAWPYQKREADGTVVYEYEVECP